MIEAYINGKDLYATIASGVYHNKYEDNLECYPDGTLNVEGKKRRSSVKSLLLGIMYGRGVASIAEQIGGTEEEAQEIIDNFYRSFPKVKKWMDKTVADAKVKGYVTDFWGRRRRLENIKLPPIEITSEIMNDNFNPLIECSDRDLKDVEKKIIEYIKKLNNSANSYETNKIKKEIKDNGFKLTYNTKLIGDATRQCVNARIQGSAATMTKIAMINIYNDKLLNDLDFHLLISVHDELIGECPKENAEAVADRLTYLMKHCIDDVTLVPFKCDADICENWYYNDYCGELNKEYKEKYKDKENGLEDFIIAHCENTRENILNILNI